MSATNPKVAFVVVGWNNKKLLNDCFASIKDQTHSNTVIIYVDNDSSDGSLEWVNKKYPKITTLARSTNTGFARGNNIGIEEALSDPAVRYIALLNTDARLDPKWTEQIVKFAAVKPKGACFQGTTLDYYNHAIIDSTHIFTARNGQGTQGNWRHYFVHDLGPKKVFGVNAAACMISRDFIEAQPFGPKLFDESLYMYLEDVDLAARATIMGWDNYLVPKALAFHMGSVSSKAKKLNFSLYMTFRNNSAVLYKNFPWKIIRKMSLRLVKGDIDTIKTLWRTNRKSEIMAVIRGRLVGLFRLPLFSVKRRHMSKIRDIDQDYLWLLMKEGY